MQELLGMGKSYKKPNKTKPVCRVFSLYSIVAELQSETETEEWHWIDWQGKRQMS